MEPDTNNAIRCVPCAPHRVGWVCIPWLLPWVRRTNDYSQQLRDIVVVSAVPYLARAVKFSRQETIIAAKLQQLLALLLYY